MEPYGTKKESLKCSRKVLVCFIKPEMIQNVIEYSRKVGNVPGRSLLF